MTLLIAVALWVLVSPDTAFFWSVFLAWWVLRLDSRILGGVAIGFLVLIPVLQYFHEDARAEQIAVYVYFLLVMVVVLQIIEFRREGRGAMIPEESPGVSSPISSKGHRSYRIHGRNVLDLRLNDTER